MDDRGHSLSIAVILGFVIGLVVGNILIRRRSKPKYLAVAEYWVYLAGEQMPPQDDLMTRMVRTNPYARGGRPPLGQQEALLFSDIRLHVALVLRSKNSSLFRRDFFADAEASPENLDRLEEAKSLVRIRYLSETPLRDKRHVQFVYHAADATAEMGDGRLIYDVVSERLLRPEDVQATLKESPEATRPELHLRTIWKSVPMNERVETLGLKKVGLHELSTDPINSDEKVLALQVIEEAAMKLWNQGSLPEELDVEAFDDTFRLRFTPSKKGPTSVRINRVQSR